MYSSPPSIASWSTKSVSCALDEAAAARPSRCGRWIRSAFWFRASCAKRGERMTGLTTHGKRSQPRSSDPRGNVRVSGTGRRRRSARAAKRSLSASSSTSSAGGSTQRRCGARRLRPRDSASSRGRPGRTPPAPRAARLPQAISAASARLGIVDPARRAHLGRAITGQLYFRSRIAGGDGDRNAVAPERAHHAQVADYAGERPQTWHRNSAQQ